MALNVRHPIWIHALDRPGATAFALIFALESFTRAILSTIVPLQVLKVVGDPASLSAVFLTVSVLGLGANFLIVPLSGAISRRRTYSLGCLCLMVAALAISQDTLLVVALGMLLRVFGVAATAICMNLYMLDHIRGRELNDLEPLRLLFSASAWTIGPWLGVFLWNRVEWLPFALSALSASLVLAYFWKLRIGDNPVIVPAHSKPGNPFASILPFVRRPALRRAWLIAFSRSVWWVSFFVYVPVFSVRSGFSEETAALLVSAGNGLLFATPFLVRMLSSLGVRRALMAAFVVTGTLTAFAGLLAWEAPVWTLAALLAAAVSVVVLDIYGNLPFLRLVKPSERLRMTPVFITYRDMSDITAPALAGAVLLVAPLPVYFLLLGGLLASASQLARTLPSRL